MAGLFANQTGSKLMGLPPELRNEIWKAVLVHDGPINVGAQVSRSPNPCIKDVGALLRTCRQIRAEAYDMYLVNNRFALSIPYDKDENPEAIEWMFGLYNWDLRKIPRIYVGWKSVNARHVYEWPPVFDWMRSAMRGWGIDYPQDRIYLRIDYRSKFSLEYESVKKVAEIPWGEVDDICRWESDYTTLHNWDSDDWFCEWLEEWETKQA